MLTPVRRRLFTLASAASLVLCVAVCALWARSFWAGDWVEWRKPTTAGFIGADRGTARAILHVGNLPGSPNDSFDLRFRSYALGNPVDPLKYLPTAPKASRFVWYGAGVAWLHYPPVRRSKGILAVLPLWLPALASAVLPSAWLASWWRQRRRTRRADGAMSCAACGYDLRASPGRCPECGATAAAAA